MRPWVLGGVRERGSAFQKSESNGGHRRRGATRMALGDWPGAGSCRHWRATDRLWRRGVLVGTVVGARRELVVGSVISAHDASRLSRCAESLRACAASASRPTGAKRPHGCRPAPAWQWGDRSREQYVQTCCCGQLMAPEHLHCPLSPPPQVSRSRSAAQLAWRGGPLPVAQRSASPSTLRVTLAKKRQGDSARFARFRPLPPTRSPSLSR